MIGEVAAEMIIPKLMGKIVDNGIYGENMMYIFRVGMMMLVIALFGLAAGIGGAYYGSKASTGLAKNLRKAMYEKNGQVLDFFGFRNRVYRIRANW